MPRCIISFVLSACMHVPAIFGQSGPIVRVETEVGFCILELDSIHAPLTVRNFLSILDRGYFDGGSFFRTVTMQNQPNDSIRIEVIQGGIAETHQDVEFAPIRLEHTGSTGIFHTDGTVSMARSSPHSATWSFFICVGDQPELDFGGKRNPDGQGFAAFGKVVKGMDVVRKIHSSNATGQSLSPPIRIIRIARSTGKQ